MTRLDTEYFRRAYWMLLRAKKIKVIFSVHQPNKANQLKIPLEWTKLWKISNSFLLGGKKKIKTKRKHSFLHKVTPSTWTKCRFLGFREKKKQLKRKDRILKTTRRNVPLFSLFQAERTHWDVGKFSSFPSFAWGELNPISQPPGSFMNLFPKEMYFQPRQF